eukprot:TRINITY_DN35228_c0_g1_i1.p1 TRINITY_DN35228_c0_g1~~TRINITY_DN35228_c0_g1_i1.p1  ORF type:complete len:555 (+),score=74.61 TRINITY_DN35228_c0_g1_i1:92-1756(+)
MDVKVRSRNEGNFLFAKLSTLASRLCGSGSATKPSLAFKAALDAGELPDLDDACSVVTARRGVLFCRCAVVARRLLPLILRVLGDHFCCSCLRRPWRAVENTRRVRLALEALGPAFVKLGQACAAREDILNDEVAAELRKLCDKVSPFPVRLARSLLLRELGSAAPAIPETPVAAASLGQVYRISLDGCEFALKVQRPDLIEVLALDVVILRRITKLVRRLASWFIVASVDLVKVVDGWALTMWHELDYKREAGASELMRKTFLEKLPRLEIPEVCWRLTSSRVLCTRWVDGKQVSEKARGVVTQEHIQVGVEAFATMILDLGLVHADPHAGNMLVTVPGGKLCLLDFGMVIRVPLSHRVAWAQCLVSMVCGDYPATLKSLQHIGFFPRGCNEAELLPVMSVLWKQLVSCGSDIKKRQVAVRECYSEILTLVRRFDFDLPDYYVALARALITLEGIALAANCEFDIFKATYPVAMRAVMASNPVACHGRQLLMSSASMPAVLSIVSRVGVTGAVGAICPSNGRSWLTRAVMVAFMAITLGVLIFSMLQERAPTA